MNRALTAEFLGTLVLVMTGIGAGIMGVNLAGGNMAIALFANAFASGLVLYLLITIFAPISGAHLNPAVSIYMAFTGAITPATGARYVLAQLVGALLAVPLTHAMFGLQLWQVASTVRTGLPLWLSEGVATFGLFMTIVGGVRYAPTQVPALVGAWIAAAFWFTGSASFANPAVTLARSFSDTFTGIQLANAPGYIIAECLAAVLAALLLPRLFSKD